MPVFLECQRCAACCRWPGQVRLNDDDLARLAAFLGQSEFDCIQRYTRLRADRHGLALQEKPSGACVFLHGRDCLVQDVKPQQCRDFPNLWSCAEAEVSCQAIARHLTESEYLRLIRVATGRAHVESSVPITHGTEESERAIPA